jgi:hypothetical protein
VRDVVAFQVDAPRGRLDEAVDHLQRRGLPAAGGAHEDHDLAFGDVQRQLGHRRDRRVLHAAREEFDPNSGPRHLEGCYVDRDNFLSRLRVLERRGADFRRH